MINCANCYLNIIIITQLVQLFKKVLCSFCEQFKNTVYICCNVNVAFLHLHYKVKGIISIERHYTFSFHAVDGMRVDINREIKKKVLFIGLLVPLIASERTRTVYNLIIYECSDVSHFFQTGVVRNINPICQNESDIYISPILLQLPTFSTWNHR